MNQRPYTPLIVCGQLVTCCRTQPGPSVRRKRFAVAAVFRPDCFAVRAVVVAPRFAVAAVFRADCFAVRAVVAAPLRRRLRGSRQIKRRLSRCPSHRPSPPCQSTPRRIPSLWKSERLTIRNGRGARRTGTRGGRSTTGCRKPHRSGSANESATAMPDAGSSSPCRRRTPPTREGHSRAAAGGRWSSNSTSPTSRAPKPGGCGPSAPGRGTCSPTGTAGAPAPAGCWLGRALDQHRRQPGLGDEERGHQDEPGDHGDAGRPPAALGLLAEGRDAVEAEEAQHRDGQGGGGEARSEVAASNSGLVVNVAPPTPLLDRDDGHDQEDDDEEQLGRQEDPVDDRGERDADVVDAGVDRPGTA